MANNRTGHPALIGSSFAEQAALEPEVVAWEEKNRIHFADFRSVAAFSSALVATELPAAYFSSTCRGNRVAYLQAFGQVSGQEPILMQTLKTVWVEIFSCFSIF
jgi:hypothetical protein